MEIDAFEHFKALCMKRKSVRKYSLRIVPEYLIQKIIEIAKTSPYASGKKNWEIEVVSDRLVITEMARIVEEKARAIENSLRSDFRGSFRNYSCSFSTFISAPILLVPTFKITRGISLMSQESDDTILAWERDTSVKSISCVCMLLLLAAESLGISSCYMTGPLIAEREIGNLIHIKNGRAIGAVIPIGYQEE